MKNILYFVGGSLLFWVVWLSLGDIGILIGRPGIENFEPKQIISELKKQRFFATVFKLHGEAENQLGTQSSEIVLNSPTSQVSARVRGASAEFVSSYFNMYLKSAPDAAIYNYLLHNITVLKMFRNKPELCAGAYLGKPRFKRGDMKMEFFTEDLNLKADIIESAVNNPSSITGDVSEVFRFIEKAYKNSGRNPKYLGKVTRVERQPPAVVCRVGTEFLEVLESLGPRQAGLVIRSLASISAK